MDYTFILREFAGLFSAVGVVLMAWGLANAFFGYKIFKVVLILCGFLTGAAVGTIPAMFLAGDGEGGIVMVLLIPVFGIIGAALSVLLHKVGVFLSVGAMGFIVFLPLSTVNLALLLGIICGIIGVIFEKYTIIISTGLSGGFLAAGGLFLLVPAMGLWGMTAVGLLTAVCGIAVQLMMERKKPAAAAAAAVAAGAAYAPRPQPQPQPVAAAAPRASGGQSARKEITRCSNCGSEIPDGTSYCRLCGHMVLSEPDGDSCFCSQCGASMSSTANFCRKCGAARGI